MNDRRSNQTTFHLLQIVLGITISMGIAIPFTLVQPDSSTAQQLKKKKQIPPPPSPPTKGFPGNRTVSASMSGGSCDLKLIALAPEFNQNPSGQISEKSVWGQTTVERPIFWFFVPSTQALKLEFSLQNRQGEDIYRAPIPTPGQPGVISVRIPTSQQPLQLDRDYRWTLKAQVPCGTTTNRVFVDGWVERVSLPSEGNRSDTFALEGIWYDAVTSLAQQRLQKPNDVQLQQDWYDLLESADLNAIAKQPLVKSGY
jgi:Domain of Unknown Function (DUF928)